MHGGCRNEKALTLNELRCLDRELQLTMFCHLSKGKGILDEVVTYYVETDGVQVWLIRSSSSCPTRESRIPKAMVRSRTASTLWSKRGGSPRNLAVLGPSQQEKRMGIHAPRRELSIAALTIPVVLFVFTPTLPTWRYTAWRALQDIIGRWLREESYMGQLDL